MTSGSLIVKNDREHQRQIEAHVLFDFGIGVVDSLIDYGVLQVDYLFNTHRHFDHIAELDRLLNSQRRNRPRVRNPATGELEPTKPPLYSTPETWKKGVAWSYPWLAGMVKRQNLDLEGPVMPGNGLGINLKVTPVPVYHGPYAHDAVIFVVEFGERDYRRKLVLCWDFLHLIIGHPAPSGVGPAPPDSYVPIDKPTPPGSHGYPNDDYKELRDWKKLYSGLENPAENLGPDELLPEHQILKEPHELFLAGNTVTPQPYTGHASIMSGMGLIRRLKPKRTWIVHYSGHEDPSGPLSDEQLQDWLDKNKAAYGLSNHEILVARHGMTLV